MCLFTERSQQPTNPQTRHMRRAGHTSPLSTHCWQTSVAGSVTWISDRCLQSFSCSCSPLNASQRMISGIRIGYLEGRCACSGCGAIPSSRRATIKFTPSNRIANLPFSKRAKTCAESVCFFPSPGAPHKFPVNVPLIVKLPLSCSPSGARSSTKI